ncbi:hypothetical protein AcW1_010350 [Taiwanofungus camphoratus]|nr:hypothetical protein AcV7_006064 [Antrodia cinnamomea]KAI0927382.1 hypothetical protein AcV5_007935 [Antrodia cinnamomea]KAI0953029.1 hypothetical protein AcW1_010350 [Antrodia cinnamomea]
MFASIAPSSSSVLHTRRELIMGLADSTGHMVMARRGVSINLPPSGCCAGHICLFNSQAHTLASQYRLHSFHEATIHKFSVDLCEHDAQQPGTISVWMTSKQAISAALRMLHGLGRSLLYHWRSDQSERSTPLS